MTAEEERLLDLGVALSKHIVFVGKRIDGKIVHIQLCEWNNQLVRATVRESNLEPFLHTDRIGSPWHVSR